MGVWLNWEIRNWKFEIRDWNYFMKNFWEKLKKPLLALAPMAGITDSAFRQLCQSFGAQVLYTEMVSADALFYNAKKTLAMLKHNKKEKYLVVQLFGKDPDKFKKAAQVVEKMGVDGIDINFGCPAKKVVRHGGGVTLMRDLNKCYAIVKAVCDSTSLPVSVKIRSSISHPLCVSPSGRGRITALDFIEKIKDLPVAAVMIHGRSYEQAFSGPPDYDMIKAVKKKFKGIVLGNGGIMAPEDAKNMLDKTGVDGVGLARGLYGKPWLFKQIKDYLKTGKYKELTFAQIKKVMLLHAQLLFKSKGPHGLFEVRKYLAWYVKGFPGAAELRQELVQIKSLKEIEKILSKI